MGLNVLHLPTSVGGNSWGLAQGERAIGLNSKVLVAEQNWLGYPCDISLSTENTPNLIKFINRVRAFLKFYKGYDVFHFNFGSTLVDAAKYFLNLLDLPFYKGVKVMTYNGCDARQKYPTMSRRDFSACHEPECYGGMCNSGFMDFVRRKRIERAARFVDHFFALNPDLFHFLPKEKTTFLPYTISRWDEIKPVRYRLKDKINIVHAPTDRGAKGSKYIIGALENIKKKYKNIQIFLVEKIPHEYALKIYQEAHLVIDQVLVGWYGGLAVEVMKMGIPVAVYINEEDLKYIPYEMANQLRETVINVNPFDLEERISYYIENSHLLLEKSKASLDYVLKWHDPKYVASIAKDIYEKYRNEKVI
ncbi:MAG: hypothetical protein ABIL13_07570 [candidate division WOR-3 bacterium]